MTGRFLTLSNGSAAALDLIPDYPVEDFLQNLIDGCDRGWRLCSLFGIPDEEGARLYALLAYKNDGILGMLTTRAGKTFPSITGLCPQAHLFEREIAEQCGIFPEGHPRMNPVCFHPSMIPGRDAWGRGNGEILPGVMDFFRVGGEEVHEVAVGPVHAGIIEPGHFRFQCHGEQVFNLEISLGYQHRGIEKTLLGGPWPRSLYQIETVAGDTTVGHTHAWCLILEALSGAEVTGRADAIRAVALELERLANHTGDLGALAGDVGYLPTSSYCGRIRGDFLNMTALICGSRFGRGLIRPGGSGFDISPAQTSDLLERLQSARSDLANSVNLLWTTTSVMARLEGTGKVSSDAARELGLVGPAARACGLSRDVRTNYPFGAFRSSPIQAVSAKTGDVYARTLLRWMEAEKSLDYIEGQLKRLPAGDHRRSIGPLSGGMAAVALVEGWRGEICHVAITDREGRFSRYKITDPSFHNWSGLAMALQNEQISDFPLCNKSFNLSYCGFDL